MEIKIILDCYENTIERKLVQLVLQSQKYKLGSKIQTLRQYLQSAFFFRQNLFMAIALVVIFLKIVSLIF